MKKSMSTNHGQLDGYVRYGSGPKKRGSARTARRMSQDPVHEIPFRFMQDRYYL